MKYLYFLYPVMGGLFGFLATIVGSHFFSTDNEYLYIAVGILLFLGCNNMLYKFNFNSYAKKRPYNNNKFSIRITDNLYGHIQAIIHKYKMDCWSMFDVSRYSVVGIR